MKTEKLSLSSIKTVLTRAELRKIMAGSGCVGITEACGPNAGFQNAPCCPGTFCSPNGAGFYTCMA